MSVIDRARDNDRRIAENDRAIAGVQRDLILLLEDCASTERIVFADMEEIGIKYGELSKLRVTAEQLMRKRKEFNRAMVD